jgi:hypothetical protein
MPSDPVHQFNPSACHADFTYTMTPDAVEIQDTGKGKKAVADDLDAVLHKIEHWHQGSIARFGSVIGALKGLSILSNGTGKSHEYSEAAGARMKQGGATNFTSIEPMALQVGDLPVGNWLYEGTRQIGVILYAKEASFRASA